MKSLICALAFTTLAVGQYRTIPSGTSVSVRTNEAIDASKSDGQTFSAVIDQDVVDSNNRVAIPRGANAELVVREMEDHDLMLDLAAVNINGQRYPITASNNLGEDRKEGLGTNKRTGKYVGAGAAVGAIIGAIAGGGKGAAIGAAAGAGAGAGAVVLTRGKKIKVPSESLLTFRLEQDTRIANAGQSFNRRNRQQQNQR